MKKNILEYNKFDRFRTLRTYLFYLLTVTLSLTLSCVHSVKKDADGNFERQVSAISTDEMLVGDNLNFYGSDSPNAGIFILKAKTDFIKGFAIKPLKFQESDKPVQEIVKQITTSPIYQLELYEIEPGENTKIESPDICNYISENSTRVKILFGLNGISFRLKERNWVVINKKVNPNSIVFIRLGIGEPFSVIKNNAIDGLWINAKKNDKPWEEFNSFDKKKVIAWSCQESSFLETKSYQASYYNPDVVFQYN